MIQNNTNFLIKTIIIITIVYGVLATLEGALAPNPILGIFIFGYVLSLFILIKWFLKYKK